MPTDASPSRLRESLFASGCAALDERTADRVVQAAPRERDRDEAELDEQDVAVRSASTGRRACGSRRMLR